MHSPIPLLPREKVLAEGISALTTQELLTLILGSGQKKIPVQVLAHKVEQKFWQRRLTLEELLQIKGIGLAKASQLLAIFELAERLRPLGTPILGSTTAVLAQLNELRFAKREQIMCLYLNARLQLLMKETLAMGSVNQVSLTPRDVFAVIKDFPVNHFILAHNHPSGDPQPSADDTQFTHNLQRAGHLLGIELIDHIIVTQHTHYSFKAHGLV